MEAGVGLLGQAPETGAMRPGGLVTKSKLMV